MKHEGKVLITDGVHPVLPKGLRQLGYTIDYQPEISLAEVHDRIHDYRGLIINSKIVVDADLLAKAAQLRWLGRLGSGLEIVDREAAFAHGVAVLSSPGGNAPAVGEHALAMILSLAAKLREGHRQVTQFDWDRESARGWELKYRTVGLIGYGHTGPAFAKTLRGFENPIVAYDKYKPNFTSQTPWVEAAVDAEEVLAKADILSLHLPLTAETIGYLDGDKMDKLPAGAVVINTSRGKVLDLAALVRRLESGRLGGACLDVFPNEKPSTYNAEEQALLERLVSLPNVRLSPHVAGWTVESKRALATILLDQITDLR